MEIGKNDKWQDPLYRPPVLSPNANTFKAHRRCRCDRSSLVRRAVTICSIILVHLCRRGRHFVFFFSFLSFSPFRSFFNYLASRCCVLDIHLVDECVLAKKSLVSHNRTSAISVRADFNWICERDSEKTNQKINSKINNNSWKHRSSVSFNSNCDWRNCRKSPISIANWKSRSNASGFIFHIKFILSWLQEDTFDCCCCCCYNCCPCV